MIFSFYVDEFRNLKMAEPIRLSSNITFVLGNCGAGKTNFCKALGDIKRVGIKSGFGQRSKFIYGFVEDNVKVVYEYLRTEEGEVVEKIVKIPEYKWVYYSKSTSYCPLDIFVEIINLCWNGKLRRVLDKCRRFVEEEMYIYVSEQVDTQEILQFNNTEHLQIKDKDISNNKIIVWDDIELCEKELIRKLFSRIFREEMQVIVSIRRTEWVDIKWGKLDDYIYIRQGVVKAIRKWTDKNIKTTEQLKNLCKKGYFAKMP